MLAHLQIENYALIEKLNLDFSPGFTVITGETGAGKSILLGALSLILGKRADTQVLFNNDKKCVVEGTFNIKDYGLKDFFTENELDYDDTLIIRREITSQGKSRAFVNDTPVSLNVLKFLAEKLVDIHSQHRTITLNDAGIQLSVVDCYALHESLLNEYHGIFLKFIKTKKELTQLEEDNAKAISDIDYSQFLYDELADAELVADEQANIESELELLANAGEIKNGLELTAYSIYESDESVVSKTSALITALKPLSSLHEDIKGILKRLESASVELKDIAYEASKVLAGITDNPGKLEELSLRLELLLRLQQKHRVNSVIELINIREKLKEKLEAIILKDEEISKLRLEADSLGGRISFMAEEISLKRKEVFPDIEKEITLILKQLAMPHAVFKIECFEEAPGHYGKDRIRFLFSANKGSEPDEISRVASGGELSRLMLAVKSMISGRTLIPTVFFDEIDSGVSGETAGRVGAIMVKMSSAMQLIAITHLPQIAGMAANHLKVMKAVAGEKTKTIINPLSREERLDEIARLLSGEKVTDAAMMAARELLQF